MVGVRQGLLPGLGCRLLLAVSVQDLGEHAERILGVTGRAGRAGVAGQACESVVAG